MGIGSGAEVEHGLSLSCGREKNAKEAGGRGGGGDAPGRAGFLEDFGSFFALVGVER